MFAGFIHDEGDPATGAPAKPSVIRKMHSDYNRIVHNTIDDHTNATSDPHPEAGFGIWLAMRQGQAYDPTRGAFAHCRDPQEVLDFDGDGSVDDRHNHDYASFNTIAYNSFSNNRCAVRVSDDFNQIVGNQFYDSLEYDLYIGDDFRGRLGDPVRGTAIVKNRSYFSGSSPLGQGIVFYAGSGDLTFMKGDMYYERSENSAGKQTCYTSPPGFPFNDCTRPKEQLLQSIFWD